jgi:hypothetical protein
MSREKRLEIRLSEKEYNKLKSYADNKEVSMGWIVRDYIKRLPNPENK